MVRDLSDVFLVGTFRFGLMGIHNLEAPYLGINWAGKPQNEVCQMTRSYRNGPFEHMRLNHTFRVLGFVSMQKHRRLPDFRVSLPRLRLHGID